MSHAKRLYGEHQVSACGSKSLNKGGTKRSELYLARKSSNKKDLCAINTQNRARPGPPAIKAMPRKAAKPIAGPCWAAHSPSSHAGR